MYFLNYVDRNAIAQARLNGLEDDLGMSGVEFNTCVSMLVFLSLPIRYSCYLGELPTLVDGLFLTSSLWF